jgi:membrane-bound lytic murein transglycosylase F
MKKKYLAALIVGLLVVLSLIIYVGRSIVINDLSDILEEGRLSVLIETGEHGFTKDSLKVYGFQYEIIKSFSNSIGVELVVINEKNTKDGTTELMKGKCDVLVSLRPVINDSTIPVKYLVPIISTRLMLVQRKDTVGKILINKQYELDSDTITLMQHSPYLPRLKDMSDEVAAEIYYHEIEQGSLDDMVRLVSENKYTYTICPEYLTFSLMSRYPNVDMSVPLSFKQDLSWSVNNYSVALHERLNIFLDEFIGSSEYWSLYQQYFADKKE